MSRANLPGGGGPPGLDRDAWRAARARRLALCEAAARDPRLVPAALAAWPLPPAVLQAAVAELWPPDSPELGSLCAWVHDPAVAGEGEVDADGLPEVEWDRRACAAAPATGTDPLDRRVAALYLLARLGEELAHRERDLPARVAWRPDARDGPAREAWWALLGPRPDLQAGVAVRRLYGGRVRAAFQGVATVLGLPESVGRSHGEAAVEQLDLLGIGAHGDLAARVIETTGEPVAHLEGVLDAAARDQVGACIAGRETWSDVAIRLGRADHGLGEGADLVVLLRLVGHLGEGRAHPHRLGLPGWGVVRANRARIRGRLRAVAAARPPLMAPAVLALDALYARTSAAITRFAWDWAWREARRGFGFDLARLSSAPCVLPPPSQPALADLDEAHEPALLAFLLLVVGRGCWTDLERWLAGASGRELSRTFYRCLEQLPDAVADPCPRGQRHRSYQRLAERLGDEGLEERMPALRDLVARVAAVPGGEGLRARLSAALSDPFEVAGVPLPQHHLTPFQESCVAFLARTTTPGEG